MPISLPIFLIALALLVLGSLLIWRVRNSKTQAAAAPVAATNHKSVRSFSYAPMPVVEPGAAAPALPADSALTRLMVEDDFKAKEERENQAEADRLEAQEAEARQQQQAQESVAAAESPTPAPAEKSPAAPAAPTQPASPAAAPAVVSVANLLSADDADELPAAAPKSSPAAPAETDDDTISPALFDNPLTAKAPTANDEENQRVGAELRRLKRETLRSKAAGEKAALTTLYAGKQLATKE